ncbi:MAG: exo-alpha-sialidase [Silvibacterium sp.]|nr:exo-alpha-sialidase [Silvibacterium sp.]
MPLGPVRNFALGIAFCSIAYAQSPLPPAPGAWVVRVSPEGGHYSEPGIAFNPNNSNQIVTVMQGGVKVEGTATAAYSTDAGRTFTRASGSGPADWKVAGDVSVAFDNKGHAYLCYLAFDKLGTAAYWAHDSGRNGIYVRRSLDGGKTWDRKAVEVKAFSAPGARDVPFEDEPRIFADTQPDSPYAGALYVGWVEWQIAQSIVLFSRSTDQGQTWSEPVRISAHAGLPRDDNGSVGGFVQAIAPDGSIYAAWDDGNSIVLTESHNGGKTFSPSRPVIEVGPPYIGETTGVSRVEGFPQIAIDPHTGKLYLCWSDYTNGDIDVFLASSGDHGRTWSHPVRVNNDPVHDGKDQFYEWLAVDTKTGAVYVEFYDRRDDPQNRKAQITLARSLDGGKTFSNYAWTKTAFDPQGAFLGDYTWTTAYNNRVYAAWTEAVAPKEPKETGQVGRSQDAKTVVLVGGADFSGVH